ncbi:MAG: NAD-dependent epimerase/dehydratase family protein [Pseudomonadales bacterium]
MEHYLVVGGLGLVGRAVVRTLETRQDVKITGVSRRTPDFETRADWLCVDLTDRRRCEQVFTALSDVTHIVYCALFEQPTLLAGWKDDGQIATNTLMLENVLDFVTPRSHLTLLQGTKAYAAHYRPMALPGKESSPRPPGANFYWNQEDMVRTRQRGANWHFSIMRPQIVCGVAVGSPMNVVAAFGVYATLMREAGMPCGYPGGTGFVTETVDADLLARAILWAGQSERARNETYNVTNGDVVEWASLWPELMAMLDTPVGDAVPRHLRGDMPHFEKEWAAIVARHHLQPLSLQALVGSSWEFADAVLGTLGGATTLLSTIKLRQHGFADCIDTAEMFHKHFAAMRDARLIP